MKYLLYIILFIGTYPLQSQTARELFSIKSPKEKKIPKTEHDYLPAAFHQKKRAELRAKMPENSVAIFFSNTTKNRSNDVDYEYHQDPNFYYLTGLNEPEAVLLIFKSDQVYPGHPRTNEILIVQKKDPADEIWNGKRIGKSQAKHKLQIRHVLNNSEVRNFDIELNAYEQTFTYNAPKHIETKKGSTFYHYLPIFKQLQLRPIDAIANNKQLETWMAELREIKSPEELLLLKKAIDMTCDAQIELMKSIKPGMAEYQSEAIIEYIFKKNGAEYTGFPSIMGSGEHSCILHYTSNRKMLHNKDLQLSDVGAEYHGYTADVTRTFPVNGKFSPEAAAIYNIVYEAQSKAIDGCVKGNKFWEPHNIAKETIAAGLIKLGILKNKWQVTQYFMHGTSHYLGLDVHDAGTYKNLRPGNVITVEPGIYIPKGSPCDKKWWNIGIRIEDDILITDDTPINLSEKAPRKLDEIENLMKEDGMFD